MIAWYILVLVTGGPRSVSTRRPGDKLTEATESNGVVSPETARLMRVATYASVSVALTLTVAKLGAWFVSDSVSLLSSLVDSLLDAGASIISLLAVRHALQPADREHRFGHGKAESLAGLGQAMFIAGSGVFLILEASDRLLNPQPVVHGDLGIAIMIIATVMTIGLVMFQVYVVRKTRSLAIKADSVHYRVDILVNVAVIASLVLSTRFGLTIADPLFAIAIVGYMGWGALKIGREAYDQLMDRELPDEERDKIKKIAMRHPKVHSVHDLRTRSSGPNTFIQLHLDMDRDISLMEAHEIGDAVMYDVEDAFPNAEVLIHQDPEGVDERRDQI